MKKIVLLLLVALAAAEAATAQTRRTTVSGVVADATTRQGLIGAMVELVPASDSTRSAVMITGAGGAFSVGTLRGATDVRASLVGYERQSGGRMELTGERHRLDTLFLQPVQIEAVVMEGVSMRTSVKGDTLIYNADSYKVAGDATVSGLLEKMPGIKVEGGAVEAQGEAVKKVLIDNKEFFGDDVAAAISSLPAEAVKNIEVFDKLSDNAEFTGIDDGEGYKAINIVTRESMRQGVMGQVSALYGAEPPEVSGEKWHQYGLVGGNVNVFRGGSRLTVGGTLNNLNERNFTSNDILGAGDDDGIARVGMLQLNYTGIFGDNNEWNVQGSYRYNATDADANSTLDREYFNYEGALYTNEYSTTRRNTVNKGHRMSGTIDWKRADGGQSLRIRPTLNFQDNKQSSNTDRLYTPVGGADDIALANWRTSNMSGWAAGIDANYRIRLGKAGRTLATFFNTHYDPDRRDGESYSERDVLDENGLRDYVRQITPTRNYDFRIGGGLTYTEPLSATSLVNLDYSLNYSHSDQNKKAYRWDTALGGGAGAYPTTPDVNLSGINNSTYTTHRVGPGYRFQKGKNTFSTGVQYQYSTLESDVTLPREYAVRRSFNNVTYSALLNTQFESGASIRMMINSRTRNPDVFDLQNIADISNVQSVSHGNPDLRPSYNNMGFVRFILPNVEMGRTLAINIGGNYTNNAITQRTVSESVGFQIIEDGMVIETLDGMGRYSEPVNMDGQWSVRGGVDYGFPVLWLRSNLNLNAGLSYSESPSQLGRWTTGAVQGLEGVVWRTNLSKVVAPNANFTLGSNISERVDFRVGYGISYNNVKNSASTLSDSEYLRHNIRADFKFVFPAQFTLAGNVWYNNYASITGRSFRQENITANAAIGKKVFRSRMGEVSLFVNDIFNQNVSFRRNSYAQYIQNQTNSAIGRYVGVKFSWNIRKFGKNASQNASNYQTENEGQWRRGDRPPPGGGRGMGGPPPGGGGFGGRGGF